MTLELFTILTNHIIVFMTGDDRSDISAQESLGQNSLNNDVTCVPFPVPERDAALCMSWRPVLLGNIRNALCITSALPLLHHSTL